MRVLHHCAKDVRSRVKREEVLPPGWDPVVPNLRYGDWIYCDVGLEGPSPSTFCGGTWIPMAKLWLGYTEYVYISRTF